MTSETTETAKRHRDSVKWFSIAEELFPKDGLVLVAVSGGPDSMALLSMLRELSGELGFRVAACHFDHQLRKTGDAERQLVAEFARGLAVPFHSNSEDVAERASSTGDSIEEAARKARYEFLFQIAGEIGADRIATGHTQDDQIETVLMRILHGTGIRGLAGIPIRRGKVVRPLLGLRRRDILEYCKPLAIPFIIDPSNEDTKFTRNRIRAELIPQLRTYNEGIDDNLLRLAKNAQEVVRNVRSKTQPLLKQNLRQVTPNEWHLNVAKIASLDETELFILFSDVFAEHLESDMDFSRVHYEQLAELVRDTRASGKRLTLPGLHLKKEYEQLIITKTAAVTTGAASLAPATLTFPGETRVAGAVVKTEILDGAVIKSASVKASEHEAYFDLNHLTLPLELRAPERGDRMQPFGMAGTKKLSDIFVDKKIPGRKRAQSLLITDAEDIIWLVGVTTSEKSRVEPTANKVVRITVNRE